MLDTAFFHIALRQKCQNDINKFKYFGALKIWIAPFRVCSICCPKSQGCNLAKSRVQSNDDDCQYPEWYHKNCFFKTHLPKTEAVFDGFAKLRYADQLAIKEELGTVQKVVVENPAKRAKKENKETPKLSDFCIESTKNVGRDSCVGCIQKFVISQIRISHVASVGGKAMWYHVPCFARSRSELGWLESGEMLTGFKRLSEQDQKMVKKQVPVIRRNYHKFVVETTDADLIELEKLIEIQNKEYYEVYDNVKSMSKKDQIEILTFNDQFIPESKYEILHQLTDVLYFGKLENCSKCYGNYYFNNTTYSCSHLRNWGRCDNNVEKPKRYAAYIPFETQWNAPFLRDFKVTQRNRAMHQFQIKDDSGQDLIQMPFQKPTLFNMEFALIGNLKMSKQSIGNAIKKMGGKVVEKIHDKLAAVISNEDEILKMGSKMTLAKSHNIQVVSEDFLTHIETTDPLMFILSRCISYWGGNPFLRIQEEEEVKSRRETLFYTKSIPEKITYKVQDTEDHHLIEVESGLRGTAHIYCGELNEKQIKYMVVLGLVDIENNKNSYYRMQLLESDDCKLYWLFESWGRISTVIGSRRLTSYVTLEEACKQFKSVYAEKVGIDFGKNTSRFHKEPGKYFDLLIDFEITNQMPKAFVKSELSRPIYELMEIIFDIKHMKEMMISCDLDLKQMPLGNIHRSQIHDSMAVLKGISKLIERNGSLAELRDASNQFYTLIPHGFSVKRAPIIDSIDVVKAKNEMLESLLNMQAIYGFLEGENGEKTNPMDTCYKKMKTNLDPLSKDAPDFIKICEIVRNTNGSTHSHYSLEVLDVFKVKRKREDVRSRKYKTLENRQMLWHGSRITNFVSILTKGLRIAPKQAPVTGYMFGKGIYFADIVSKSANYSLNCVKNNIGVLLLCDVALGKSKNAEYAHNYTDLPNENEQSVKGCGEYFPTEYSTLDGLKVASGGLRKANFPTGLKYNEYVVYDISQVKMKYLVKVKFRKATV